MSTETTKRHFDWEMLGARLIVIGLPILIVTLIVFAVIGTRQQGYDDARCEAAGGVLMQGDICLDRQAVISQKEWKP